MCLLDGTEQNISNYLTGTWETFRKLKEKNHCGVKGKGGTPVPDPWYAQASYCLILGSLTGGITIDSLAHSLRLMFKRRYV